MTSVGITSSSTTRVLTTASHAASSTLDELCHVFAINILAPRHLSCPVSDPRVGRFWRFPESASLLDVPPELPFLPGDQLPGDSQSRADAGI